MLPDSHLNEILIEQRVTKDHISHVGPLRTINTHFKNRRKMFFWVNFYILISVKTDRKTIQWSKSANAEQDSLLKGRLQNRELEAPPPFKLYATTTCVKRLL